MCIVYSGFYMHSAMLLSTAAAGNDRVANGNPTQLVGMSMMPMVPMWTFVSNIY